MESIRVKCRNCGRDTRSDELVLDPVYRKMVCPYCVSERRQREQVHKEVAEQRLAQKEAAKPKDKPAGWDHEDDYLERAYKQKQDNKVRVEWIDKVKARYTCQKCGFKFTINAQKIIPAHCPYCGADVKEFA